MHPNDRGPRWLAVAPPLAVGLLLIAGGLTPHGLDQPIRTLHVARSELTAAAAQSGRLYLCAALIILGLGGLAVSFLAIGTLCARRPGSRLATLAVAVAWLACLSGAVVNSLVNLNVAGATRAHESTAAAAQILFTINTDAVPTVSLVVYVGGLIAASILIAAALWRARTVPRTLAALLPLSLTAASIAPPGPAGVLLSVPFAAVMILLAARIWQQSEPSPSVYDRQTPQPSTSGIH